MRSGGLQIFNRPTQHRSWFANRARVPAHRDNRRPPGLLREAGDPSKPTVVLLHGFPTSSHMFRNLISELSDEYHLVAPDHIGFGFSDMPAVDEFEYEFENLTTITFGLLDQLGLEKFELYIMDYGAPIGLRIASRNPERVTALLVQSGNAYMEGFTPFWDRLFAHAEDRPANEASVREYFEPETTHWQDAMPTSWPRSH